MGCRKFLLFALNFLVFIAGGVIVALASIVINRTSTYSDLLQDGILTLPVIILIIGLAVGLIGFFGCFGAMRENKCMLYTYASIVMVLFIAQVILGVLVVVYQDEARATGKDTMKDVFEHYNSSKDEALADTIDTMQSDLECCGVNGYEDWFAILPTGNDVTRGCCKKGTDVDNCFRGARADQSEIYTRGCFEVIEDKIESVSIGLGAAAIALAIIQLVCILIACGLGRQVSRRGEYA